jgi:hypothetical protein
MKKAELEKHKGKKITGGGYGRKDRFGRDSSVPREKTPLSGATAGLLKGFLKTK